MKRRWMIVAVLCVTALGMTGCQQGEDIVDLRDSTREAVAQGDQTLADLEAKRAEIAARVSDLEAQAESAATEAERMEAAAAAAAEQADLDEFDEDLGKATELHDQVKKRLADLEKIVNDDGTVSQQGITQAIAAVLPPQWSLPATLVVGFIGGLFRRRRQMNVLEDQLDVAEMGAEALDGLVRAIDRAKSSNPNLSSAMSESGSTIRAELDSASRSLIDELRTAA